MLPLNASAAAGQAEGQTLQGLLPQGRETDRQGQAGKAIAQGVSQQAQGLDRQQPLPLAPQVSIVLIEHSTDQRRAAIVR